MYGAFAPCKEPAAAGEAMGGSTKRRARIQGLHGPLWSGDCRSTVSIVDGGAAADAALRDVASTLGIDIPWWIVFIALVCIVGIPLCALAFIACFGLAVAAAITDAAGLAIALVLCFAGLLTAATVSVVVSYYEIAEFVLVVVWRVIALSATSVLSLTCVSANTAAILLGDSILAVSSPRVRVRVS